MNKKQLETAAKVIEHLNRKERTNEAIVLPEKDSEVLATVMKTYEEQGIPKSMDEVLAALEEISDNGQSQAKTIPVEKLKTETPFYSLKQVATVRFNWVRGSTSCECARVAEELKTHLLKIKPYNDEERFQHLEDEIEQNVGWEGVLPWVLGLGFGILVFGPFALQVFKPSWVVIWASIVFSLLYSLKKSMDISVRRLIFSGFLKDIQIGLGMGSRKLEAEETFHRKFSKQCRSAQKYQPSLEFQRLFFQGHYQPSQKVEWNERSGDLWQAINKEEILKNVLDAWDCRRQDLRQQDVWNLYLLGKLLGLFPHEGWVTHQSSKGRCLS